MEEKAWTSVLVPLGLSLLGIYYSWLIFEILRHPRRTTIGLNAESRRRWVLYPMSDPLKNGVLAVQTIRNNIMASTLLAMTSIALSSLFGVFVSSTLDPGKSVSRLVYGNKTSLLWSVKYFSILVCFLVAFLCNVQSIRYYAHASFLTTLPTAVGKKELLDYAARSLNRGSYFSSLGLRAYYMSFPLFLWIFWHIPMLACCFLMVCVLYFLDTTTSFTRELHHRSNKEAKAGDLEAATFTDLKVASRVDTSTA